MYQASINKEKWYLAMIISELRAKCIKRIKAGLKLHGSSQLNFNSHEFI